MTATPMPSVPPAPAAVEALGASAASLRVLLVEELEPVVERVVELLGRDRRVQLVETVRDGRAAMQRITEARPDVVIIDALLQGTVEGAQVARQMRAAGLETPIIFLTVPELPVRVTPDLGLAATMMLPLDGDTLLRTIARLDEACRGPVALPPSGVVAVFSAKGGVGRSTIAHNLALALERRADTRAVLVDGDLAHGDLRLQLGAPESAPSLLGLPTGHVAETDVAPLLWQDAAGVDVLLAPPRMEQADLIMLSDIRNALSVLRRLYGVVVVDLPAVMDDTTLAILDDADVVLDVVTPERGAVLKTQRCHAVLAAAAFPMHKVVSIANRADADGAVADALSAELGRRMAASLPFERRLADGLPTVGAAIVADHPDAPLSRAFADLAAMVASRVGGGVMPVAALAA